MAWEARWGLKLQQDHKGVDKRLGLNGVGGPLGIETIGLLSFSTKKASV